MIDEGYLDDPVWRECTLRVMAGVLARRPSALDDLLDQRDLDSSLLREARAYLTPDTLVLRDQILKQALWNRLIAVALASHTKLRCLLIKILIGGFVQSNSVEEYAREFRRFVVELAAAYFPESHDDAVYARLDVQEALVETESQRAVGQGQVWRG